MKRWTTATVALVCTAALAAPASAGDKFGWQGLIEKDPNNSFLGLDVKRKNNGKQFIKPGLLGAAPFTCVAGTQSVTLFESTERIPIGDDGRFANKQTADAGGDPVNLKISGRLRNDVIKGLIGWRFSSDPGVEDDCYTGQLTYKVRKGKVITRSENTLD